jgi:parvulin-like peptidyl-prolyl isomerase
MTRRVPLPRLTHRQRMSRWQRERRQQAIVVTVFTAILVFVLGLAAWAASDRYYTANLVPAAEIDGAQVPKREYQAQLKYELVRLYQDYGVPPGFENDPQIESLKGQYAEVALERVVEQHVLDASARQAGIVTTARQIDEQYQIEFGEFRVRHILVLIAKDATDAAAAEATAKAKARAIANQLREAPMDQDLWNAVALASSEDPGSKESGGELGFAGRGQYVSEFEEAIRTLAIGQISDPVRTQFGFHVIQVEEKRAAADTDIVKKYKSYGYTEADLRRQARYEILRKEFERRQLATVPTGPTEQVHLAKIVVRLPSLAGGDFQAFTDALKKQTAVREALEGGKDFAVVAKESSDDTETKEKGGDAGWVARGMITSPEAEALVFRAEAGKTTEPISTTRDWTVYKVLEKDPARELAEDQRTTLKQSAYQYWLARQKKVYNVRKLIPGLSIE